jgi:glucose/mannose-6-phosphate isomerase
MPTILDNLSEIKQLDSQNMLGSLELIGKQVEQIVSQVQGLKLPTTYKKIQNIVVLGMGGSTLGAHVIKALFFNELPIPVEIINGYHIPAYTSSKSLVLVSSYSGTTEEPVFAMKEAQKRKAKLLIISSGGLLAQAAKKNKLPALIYSTENNPCGSPRMGLGYSLFGPILLLSKLGIIRFGSKEITKTLTTFEKYQALFGTSKNTSQNIAKQCAEKTVGKTTWYSGSEHLGGNVHVGANQMNENAKRFGGYFLIPELNHHLIEGMKLPISNAQNVLFICIEAKITSLNIYSF